MRKSFGKSLAVVLAILLVMSLCSTAFVGCDNAAVNSKNLSTQESVSVCRVTFFVDNGSAVPLQNVQYGQRVVEPVAPIKYGYDFGGWYKDSTLTTRWIFDSDTVSAPTLTLYAKWSKKQVSPNTDVTVTFNIGKDARLVGSSNPPAVTAKAGDIVAEPTVAFAGNTLVGWYVENTDVKWNFATDKLIQNTTLFARWQAGGSGSRVEYTPTMQDDNTLYIHYLRNDGDYDGWCAWVWCVGQNGRRNTSTTVDASGTVIKVDLQMYGSPTVVKFKIAIISEGGNWGDADGGDNELALASAQKVGDSYHWYITEDNTGAGKEYAHSTDSSSRVTEPKRASRSNVDRTRAQNLPVMPTAVDWDEAGVGYQIFVASFCDSNGDGVGDINGIISKLDYLQNDLNVDVLWLTPIQMSDSLHGYDCYDYYSVNPRFGTNADYRELVYRAHQRGMKVIMDLVVNHTSRKNEWFVKSQQGVIETVTYQDGKTAEVNYRDFYRWKNTSGERMESAGDGWYFYSSFGGNMPELNYDYQPVRDAMTDVAMYWLKYGLDGFRMDAIKHVFMWEESVNASGDQKDGDGNYEYNLDKNIEFFKEFNYNLKTEYPYCYLLGEQLNGNPDEVAPFYAGMDSLFDFNMYYEASNRITDVSGAVTAINGNAQKYAQYRENGRPINSMISSNHDIPRLSTVLDNNVEKIKQYFAVMLTLPGLPWIYYGDEIGLKGGNGDDRTYRQSMKWTADWSGACQNDIANKSLNLTVSSVAEQKATRGSILDYVKRLTSFRNSNPVLINGTAVCSAENGMLKITVTGGGKQLIVYHNYTSGVKTVSGNIVFGTADIPAYGTAIVG